MISSKQSDLLLALSSVQTTALSSVIHLWTAAALSLSSAVSSDHTGYSPGLAISFPLNHTSVTSLGHHREISDCVLGILQIKKILQCPFMDCFTQQLCVSGYSNQ